MSQFCSKKKKLISNQTQKQKRKENGVLLFMTSAIQENTLVRNGNGQSDKQLQPETNFPKY